MSADTARLHLVLGDIDDAAISALSELGVPGGDADWRQTLCSFTKGQKLSQCPESERDSLLCILAQCAQRSGSPELAFEFGEKLFGDGMVNAPVQYVVSCAHGLAKSRMYDKAEQLLRGRIVALEGHRSGSSSPPKKAKQHMAGLVEYLLFHIVLARNPLSSEPRIFLSETRNRKVLSASTQVAFEKRLATHAQSVAANATAKVVSQSKPTSNPAAKRETKTDSKISGGRQRPDKSSSPIRPVGTRRAAALGRQVQPLPLPSFRVRLFRLAYSRNGIVTLVLLVLLSYVLRPSGRAFDWLRRQVQHCSVTVVLHALYFLHLNFNGFLSVENVHWYISQLSATFGVAFALTY
eukprot:SAG31_NODE_3251_length_4490_cov_2.556821_1_plen_351_part_00